MELSSQFKLTTKSGHSSLHVVKSGIHEYARRGMPIEMLQVVYELDAFKAFESESSSTTRRAAKAIRTSMINCLKTILFDEVSFSQVGAFTTVAEKIKEWEDGGRVDKSALAEIVSIIAHAKKLRVPSYLYGNYGKGEDVLLDKNAFLSGVDNKDIKCLQWIYHNDKEALNMLEERGFPGKDHILPMIITEWKRLKPTKSKVGSNKRFSFVVVPWLWLMYETDLSNTDGANPPSFDKKKIEAIYNKNDVRIDNVGTLTNEDDAWLFYFQELKDHYHQNQPEVAQIRLRKAAVNPDSIKNIHIDVDEVQLILKGVRAGKLPCGYLSIKGKDKVIKPMNKGLNYGMDYLYIDRQKRLFGLRELDVKVWKIRGKVLTMKHCEQEKDGTIVKKKTYEWETSEHDQVIVIMNKVNNGKNFNKCKDLLKDEEMFKEMIKIMLFNGFFRTSDNTTRNILVDENNALWAIDQNSIYGARRNIFNKNESAIKSPFLTAELIESVIDELDFATHEQTLVEEMYKCFPKASCQFYESQLRERVHNYKQIVLNELKLGTGQE